MATTLAAQSDYLSKQKRYKCVRFAIEDKEPLVLKNLKGFDIDIAELNILIVAYKSEGELEIYAKKKSEKIYQKIITYNICSKSGQLGPKRKQGDYQVPEGFYYIDRFNPASNFYLSLGLNYPNLSDRRKSKSSNLGGDIFIHGSCVTIGCLPMTDDIIKEIYLYAINAKNNGQSKIPVYIFPFRMSVQKFNKYKETYGDRTELLGFWKNIKQGFVQFKKDNIELDFQIDKNGNYIFK